MSIEIDLRASRDAAKAFAREHLRECAAEIIEWKSTGVLCDGRLREMAKLCNPFAGPHSLSVAESFVVTAALQTVSRNPETGA